MGRRPTIAERGGAVRLKDIARILRAPKLRWQERRADPLHFYSCASNERLRNLALGKSALFGPTLNHWNDKRWRQARLSTLFGGLRRFELTPSRGEAFEAAGTRTSAPNCVWDCIETGSRPLPCGWVLCSYEIRSTDRPISPVLWVDVGGGRTSAAAIPLAGGDAGAPTRLVCLPQGRSWRLALSERDERCELGQLEVHPLSVVRAVNGLVSDHGYSLADAVHFVYGGDGVSDQPSYDHWIVLHDMLRDRDRALIRAAIRRMVQPPRFTVIVPRDGDEGELAGAAVESVVQQLYPEWELFVVGGDGRDGDPSWLTARYAQRDQRVRFLPDLSGEGLETCINRAIAESRGSFVAMLRPSDLLSEHALYLVAEAAVRGRDVTAVYGDFDHLDERGVRCRPCFKPAWNYDLFLQKDLLQPFAALRRDVVEKCGGVREGYDGHRGWDLGLRFVEHVEPSTIVRVPFVLCHVGVSASAASRSADPAAARRAVGEHLTRRGAEAAVEAPANGGRYHRIRWSVPETPPAVTLIVPTRNHVDMLRPCIDSVLRETRYPAFDIIVVDNGSTDREAISYLKALSDETCVEVVSVPGAFNFSRLCNHGLARASGEIYVLLNNDTQVIQSDWLHEMVSHAVRPEVGAVGAKLRYPDGDIQHAGVILGVRGLAGHAFRQQPGDSDGYCGRARMTQELSAVTAACLAGRTSVYLRFGGFNELDVGVGYNDVDFCLRLREAGYRIVWTPHAELLHVESGSRRSARVPQAQDVLLTEARYLERRWGRVLLDDPAYNPNLSLGAEDFRRTGRPRVSRPWLSRGRSR